MTTEHNLKSDFVSLVVLVLSLMRNDLYEHFAMNPTGSHRHANMDVYWIPLLKDMKKSDRNCHMAVFQFTCPLYVNVFTRFREHYSANILPNDFLRS